jgi:tetratricopeptide (TPR) repeat protein
MATVYLAEDLRHGRRVAIKLLRPGVAEMVGAERFLREIKTIALLQHPHILGLIDSGNVEGTAWYVMPFVDGESLRARLERERQLSLGSALQIVRDVASALDHAHRHGVQHRDIKPENILLQGDEAQLADFGISSVIGATRSERLTETGLTLGTPAYMSPEQAAGERNLDGRSDIYALGCVMYEMLVGEPPHTGPTAQAIMAKRQYQAPAPIHLARENIPTSVEQAVMKALARVPADRFTTAAEFAAALSATAEPAPSREVPTVAISGPKRHWAPVAIAGLLLVAAAIVLARRPPAPTPDPNLVAIAPITVHGADLETWHEGLVEYLSRSLDGAGTLRTVSPSLFLRDWTGTGDVASARALGRRTGAGLVVFGSLLRGGLDSVRLSASLVDLAGNANSMAVEVGGTTEGMDRLADSAAVALLQALGQTRPVGAVRRGGLGHASMPALKEYLQGEAMYRRNDWDSALVHYNRAVELDSGFALAQFRMWLTLGWHPRTLDNYRSLDWYASRAIDLNHGLSPHDSLLIASMPERTDTSAAEELVRRYPGDPEAWQALGEALYHNADTQPNAVECLPLFDRAIALDSGFVPAYKHILGLALRVGGRDLARRYARAFLSLNPAQAQDDEIRAAALLLEPATERKAADSALVAGLSAVQLYSVATEHLALLMDSSETAVRLMRSLVAGGHSRAGAPDFVADSLMWPQYLASALVLRGHLREAYRILSGTPPRAGPQPWYSVWMDPSATLALMGVIPEDSANARFQRRGVPGVGYIESSLAWWLGRRDTTRLLRFASQAATVARADHDQDKRRVARYQEGAARAYLILIRGDSVAALRSLTALPDSACLLTGCFFQRLTEARLLAARDDLYNATRIYDRWRFGTLAPNLFWIIATLEQGRVAERQGDNKVALNAYQFVLDAWRNADPELQAYTREAREGLTRLTSEGKK